jgi:hypothetical protein
MDVLRIALCHQHAGRRVHVDDEVQLLGALRRVEKRVPHDVDLPGHRGRDQARPGADGEIDRDADTSERRPRQIGIKADQFVEVLWIALTERDALAVLANLDGLAGKRRIVRCQLSGLTTGLVGVSRRGNA